jgi:hypothetical protein
VVISSCKSEYHTITTTTASDVLNVVRILWYVEYVWYFSSLTGSQKPDLWWMSSVYLSKLLILNKGSRIYTTYYIYKKKKHFFTFNPLLENRIGLVTPASIRTSLCLGSRKVRKWNPDSFSNFSCPIVEVITLNTRLTLYFRQTYTKNEAIN